jgi:hypothetical protein
MSEAASEVTGKQVNQQGAGSNPTLLGTVIPAARAKPPSMA